MLQKAQGTGSVFHPGYFSPMTTKTNDVRPSSTAVGIHWKRQLANWKTYALAGGASLAAGTNADAQIVFATVGNSITGADASSKLTFAVNGHAVLAIQTHQPGIAGASFGTGLLGGRSGIRFYNSHGLALNYQKGAAIGKASANLGSAVGLRSVQKLGGGLWSTQGKFGSASGQHTRAGAVEGYVGFKTTNGDKGWIKLIVGPAGSTNAGVAITVEAYAYNSTPGGSINAGDTGDSGALPEPGTMALVLLAAGAAGLSSIRRARARVASETESEPKVEVVTS